MGVHRADLLVLGGEGDLRSWLAYDAAERDLAAIDPHADVDALIDALAREFGIVLERGTRFGGPRLSQLP